MEAVVTFPLKDAAFQKLNEKLINLLVSLEDHRSTKSPSVSADLIQVRKSHARVEIFYKIIESSLSLQSSTPLVKLQKKYSKLVAELSEALQLSKLPNYIYLPKENSNLEESPDENKALTLFNLDGEAFIQTAKSLVSPTHLVIMEEVAKLYLNDQCANIVSFVLPDKTFKRTCDGIQAVSDHITDLKDEIKHKKLALVKQQSYNNSLISLVFDQAFDCSRSLEELMRTQRFSEYPYLHLSNLGISLKAYLLKLKYLKLELLASTYTSDFNQSLRNTEKKLNEKIATLQHSLAKIQLKLSLYDNCDSKFKDLLREYNSLMRDIEVLSMTTSK